MKVLSKAICMVLAVTAGFSIGTQAKVVGMNTPAPSLTAERIRATLPKAQQGVWLAYLDRSVKQEAADRAAFAAEVKAAGGLVTLVPKAGFAGHSMPLDKDAVWYGSAEALQIADTILSFQLPSGGWSKNLDMRQPARLPGESYTTNNLSKYPDATDFDTPRDPQWEYVGTLDNDATNTELKFLRSVIEAVPVEKAKRYQAAYLRGIEYLLHAQYPNGGWPQVWPLQGGYHDAITFNDNAVTESMEVLEPVSAGEVAFAPVEMRRRAKAAVARGLECILKTQIVVNEKKTIWGQQHDALTLVSVAGRNFEPPSLASGESDDVLLFLMDLPQPSPAVQASIVAGVAWFRSTQIMGYAWGGTRNVRAGVS